MIWRKGADLSFIHLGISVQNMTKSFSIFGVSFAYYGLIIGIGMIAGLLVAQQDAKRRGQDPEIYLDFMLYGVIFAIIGARLYYVVFQWGYYKDHLAEIFNIRKGGLAIYGGIIAAVVTLIVFTRKRKLSFLSMADSACLGLVHRADHRPLGKLCELRGLRRLYGQPVRHEDQTEHCQ